MNFHVLNTRLILNKNRKSLTSLDATLFVFRSGDFLVVPSIQKFSPRDCVFKAKRERVTFNFRWVSLSEIPFTRAFCFLSVLTAWLLRRRWRLSPSRATVLRSLLVSHGFNLLYVKDDLYRVSFFRSSRFKTRFFRKLPALTFIQADYSKLVYTTFTGLNIYFNGRKK
jgi:hypothetical protein